MYRHEPLCKHYGEFVTNHHNSLTFEEELEPGIFLNSYYNENTLCWVVVDNKGNIIDHYNENRETLFE